MKLINLTKYPVILDGETILPGGYEAQANGTRNSTERLNINGRDIYISCITYNSVITGLPEYKNGIGYIVTENVAKTVKGREDIFAVEELKKGANGYIYHGITKVVGL